MQPGRDAKDDVISRACSDRQRTRARARVGSKLALGLALALAGCREDDAGGGGDAPPPPPPPPAPIVRIVVDANRNGVLDLATNDDDEGRNGFDAKRGAVVLANIDDDDRNAVADADSDAVDGDADVQDLSPLAIRAWPKAPDGTTARIMLDGVSAPRMRLFRVDGPPELAASYAPMIDLAVLEFTTEELRAGIPLAIEARTLRLKTAANAWDGRAHLTLELFDAGGGVVGRDEAQLRVAPVLFQFNTAPTERVLFANSGGAADTLAEGITPVCTDGIAKEQIAQRRWSFDPWTQDYFDVAYISRPGPGGKPVGMKVALRAAQPDRTAGDIVNTRFRGPDFAALYVRVPGGIDAESHGYSMNSFGNWDVIPPYVKGADKFPLGRNIWGEGEGDGEQPDPEFVDFVHAQAVQPGLTVDTSWLAVGHVDEYLTWVKTNTPRGWGMLVADPALARDMLLGLQANGHGETPLFVGRTLIEMTGMREREVSATRTIDQILANADVMATSQAAQATIDLEVAALAEELGLADAELTPMPFLFERVFGAAVAYQPGTVNLLHANGRVAIAKPFGPAIDGADPFETDLVTRLGSLGLEVSFVDNWDTYHRNMGEVHCGTNVSRDMTLAWWESGR